MYYLRYGLSTLLTLTHFDVAIQKETGFNNVEYGSLELSEFASIKAFADRFEKDDGDLDILVANAAIATFEFSLTSDGYDRAYVSISPSN